MYFARIEPLKQQFREGGPNDREALPYIVGYVGFVNMLFIALPEAGTQRGWDLAIGYIDVCIAIVGTIYVFRKNGGATGRDFVVKYFVLGWVVAFRLLPLVMVIIIAWMVALAFNPEFDVDEDNAVNMSFDVLLTFLFTGLYYQRLGKHVADTRRPKAIAPELVSRD